ncbi:MAG: hypothetical protein MUF38_16245 [Anaerolineae bacterium]|nr:hypothetical protein [Anaerolineae bacterium]
MKRTAILLILALVAIVPAAAQEDPPVSPLAVEKFVGLEGAWFTADSAPGLTLPVGQAVTYRLVVSNTSADAALTNLTLTDSLYPITDCEIPAELAAGQSFECVVGPIASEEVGQTVNVALATATTADGETLTALDSATLTTTEATGEVITIIGTLESIDGRRPHPWFAGSR